MPLHLLLLLILQHQYHLILTRGLYQVPNRRPFPHWSLTMSPTMVLEGSPVPLTAMVLEENPFPLAVTNSGTSRESLPQLQRKNKWYTVGPDDAVLVYSVEDGGRWDKFARQFS